MSKKDDSGKYWPYMILGFLFIGLTLGYWTIKNTISLPIQNSNTFMMKYQEADKNANLLEEAQQRFNSKYSVEISGLESVEYKPKHLKRKPHKYVLLHDKNSFSYKVTTKDGKGVDANVTLLLTRPDSDRENILIENIKGSNGVYEIKDLPVKKLGRFIIRSRFIVGKDVKYIDTYGVRLK